MHDILAICKMPQKKTHVLHKANLSSVQTDYYFEILLANGLLQFEPRQNLCGKGLQSHLITTEKGREVLQILGAAVTVSQSIIKPVLVQKILHE